MSREWTRRSIEEIMRHVIKTEGGGGGDPSEIAKNFYGSAFAPANWTMPSRSSNTYPQLTFVDFNPETRKAAWALTLVKEDTTTLQAGNFMTMMLYGQAGSARDPWPALFSDEVFFKYGHMPIAGMSGKPGEAPPVDIPMDRNSPYKFLTPPTFSQIMSAVGGNQVWDAVYIGAAGVKRDETMYPIKTQDRGNTSSQPIRWYTNNAWTDYDLKAKIMSFNWGDGATTVSEWVRAIKFIELTV